MNKAGAGGVPWFEMGGGSYGACAIEVAPT